MRTRCFAVACMVCALTQASWSAGFVAHVDSGEVLVWQKFGGEWVTVKDSLPVAIGDSLFCDNGNRASLHMGDSCDLLLKAPCRLSTSGDQAKPVFGLVQGEVFLKREGAQQTVAITAKGCTFTPAGTAAAVKFTKLGEPSTAVLRGSMKMETADGRSVTVGARSYGTLDVNNAFKQGALPDNAVKALESWAGVTADTPPPAAAQPPAGETAKPATAQPASTPATPAGGQPKASTPAQTTPAPTATSTAEKKPEQKPAAKAEGSAQASKTQASASGSPADTGKSPQPEAKKEGEKKKDEKGDRPTWGLGAGPVTVGDELWTRVIFFGDIPLWKFGIGIDVEVFINADGQFDQKGWEFTEDTWYRSVLRKIRYLRFGHEKDHLFVKVGGLDNVTLAYGFIMDRFTNMLHYPDEKLLGLQFYLNDLTPIGLALQTVIPDFLDFGNDGGVVGARFALKPLKMTSIPIVKGIDIGITGAYDRNQFAPARSWDLALTGDRYDRDDDGITDSTMFDDFKGTTYYDSIRQVKISEGQWDDVIENPDAWAKRATDRFSVVGADLTVPIISGKVLGLDVYGQYALSIDNENDYEPIGWGIGAPGVGLRVGPMLARAEYRHTDGRFTPGYFGPYYFDERLRVVPLTDSTHAILTKEQSLGTLPLNGVYGMLEFNIKNILLIGGSYQYLVGDEDALDHRFEATAGLGDLLISKIPKLKKAEGYFYKENIGGSENPKTHKMDCFFTPTPYTYYGYRLGFEIIQGAMIVWDARYGFEYDLSDKEGKARQTLSNVGIQATLTF